MTFATIFAFEPFLPKSVTPMANLVVLLVIGLLAAVGESRHPHRVPPNYDFQQRNFDTIQKIYNTTIYPNNQAFIQKGISEIPKGLFNKNATGRIAPVGNFSGIDDTAEYFFALNPAPVFPLYDTWTNAKIVSFSSGCPEVASSVVYGATTGVNPNASTYGKTVTTIKQVAFWRFDDTGAVIYYDAWFSNLADFVNLYSGLSPSPQVNAAQIQQLCSNAQRLCTGSNTQYNSTKSCIQILSQKTFGSWNEVWGDNVVCRTLHVLLARIRPNVHCPHVGPSGGGKCVNVLYNDVYFDDEKLFGAPLGETFMCRNLTAD